MDCDTWPVPDTGECASGCVIPATTDPGVLASVSAQAGQILRTLSGGRAGTCEETIRPIGECCDGRGCRCCGTGDRIRVQSSTGPITSVTQVKVDGQVVPTSDYRFYPSTQLLYRTPDQRWPRTDHKWADCDDTGTMCVDVVVGYEPDAWALSVHAELTCELLKSCAGEKCRLPRNATQVVGQGITVTLTPAELKQFIPSVAGWVAAVNPNAGQNVARLYSPDTASGGGGCGC